MRRLSLSAIVGSFSSSAKHLFVDVVVQELLRSVRDVARLLQLQKY